MKAPWRCLSLGVMPSAALNASAASLWRPIRLSEWPRRASPSARCGCWLRGRPGRDALNAVRGGAAPVLARRPQPSPPDEGLRVRQGHLEAVRAEGGHAAQLAGSVRLGLDVHGDVQAAKGLRRRAQCVWVTVAERQRGRKQSTSLVAPTLSNRCSTMQVLASSTRRVTRRDDSKIPPRSPPARRRAGRAWLAKASNPSPAWVLWPSSGTWALLLARPSPLRHRVAFYSSARRACGRGVARSRSADSRSRSTHASVTTRLEEGPGERRNIDVGLLQTSPFESVAEAQRGRPTRLTHLAHPCGRPRLRPPGAKAGSRVLLGRGEHKSYDIDAVSNVPAGQLRGSCLGAFAPLPTVREGRKVCQVVALVVKWHQRVTIFGWLRGADRALPVRKCACKGASTGNANAPLWLACRDRLHVRTSDVDTARSKKTALSPQLWQGKNACPCSPRVRSFPTAARTSLLHVSISFCSCRVAPMRGLRRVARALAGLGHGVATPGSCAVEASQATSSTAGLARSVRTSALAAAPVDVRDEIFNRQRSVLPLEDRVPEASPDSWVAPSAIVVGDVDLFDKASAHPSSWPGRGPARRDRRVGRPRCAEDAKGCMFTAAGVLGHACDARCDCGGPVDPVQVVVWYKAVLRGDLAGIKIGYCSTIGEGAVLHAARSVPTGLSADTWVSRAPGTGRHGQGFCGAGCASRAPFPRCSWRSTCRSAPAPCCGRATSRSRSGSGRAVSSWRGRECARARTCSRGRWCPRGGSFRRGRSGAAIRPATVRGASPITLLPGALLMPDSQL